MLHALFLVLAANPISVHIRVDGSGYLRFARESQILFASEANLTVHDGILQTSDGAVVIPRIHVPTTCQKIGVSLDGRVSAIGSNGSDELGQLVLAMLPDEAAKPGLFKSTLHGALLNPGEGLAGVIRSSSSAKKTSAPVLSPREQVTETLKIVVRKVSEVENDNITLGDIATFSGPKDRRGDAEVIDLGRTPQMGASIRYSEGFIATRLRLAGFKPDDYTLEVPEGATVTRPSQVITSAKFVAAALDAIKERYDVGVELRPDTTISDLKVPKGDLVLTAELGAKTERSISVLVMAEVDGKRVGSRAITMVPTEDQVGVRVGDHVTIRLLAAGATVQVSGTVRSAGWVGQTVTVLADTGSVHTAKVISNSLVEVQL